MNIAFDKYDNPVVLDFGSCKSLGENLVSAGTPGWGDGAYISKCENDESAMEKLQDWLIEQDLRYRAKDH